MLFLLNFLSFLESVIALVFHCFVFYMLNIIFVPNALIDLVSLSSFSGCLSNSFSLKKKKYTFKVYNRMIYIEE